MKRFKRRAGFTLVEIIAVLVIIGILAAIAVPSIAAYLQMGYQTNRMSIARTIFLGAQNQLTEMRITGELTETGANSYGNPANTDGNVFTALGITEADWPDAGGDYGIQKVEGVDKPITNKDVVQYISKQKGQPQTISDWRVYNLLNPVIVDKSILNEAILIEYNIRTGVVLSAFYGDSPGNTSFT